jgi:hypothetical protein
MNSFEARSDRAHCGRRELWNDDLRHRAAISSPFMRLWAQPLRGRYPMSRTQEKGKLKHVGTTYYPTLLYLTHKTQNLIFPLPSNFRKTNFIVPMICISFSYPIATASRLWLAQAMYLRLNLPWWLREPCRI